MNARGSTSDRGDSAGDAPSSEAVRAEPRPIAVALRDGAWRSSFDDSVSRPARRRGMQRRPRFA
ncbi:MAG: hypothetical protein MZW92_63720 [Comamonadaceae bacterium]|nr:hypothetical protein [Comamonadaceae bacterium]